MLSQHALTVYKSGNSYVVTIPKTTGIGEGDQIIIKQYAVNKNKKNVYEERMKYLSDLVKDSPIRGMLGKMTAEELDDLIDEGIYD